MLIPITRTIKNFYLLYYGFTAAFLSSFCCNPLGTTVFGLRSARCAQEFSCISLIFRTFVPILSRLCLFCLFSWFFLSSIYVETQPACASCVYMSYSICRPVCSRQNQIHTFWVLSVSCRSILCFSTAASFGSYPMHFIGLLGLPHFS